MAAKKTRYVRKRITAEERAFLWKSTGGHCYLCKKSIELKSAWHVEHVLAFIRNHDMDVIGNMLPACATCNLRKHDRSLEDCVTRDLTFDLDTSARDIAHLLPQAKIAIEAALAIKHSRRRAALLSQEEVRNVHAALETYLRETLLPTKKLPSNVINEDIVKSRSLKSKESVSMSKSDKLVSSEAPQSSLRKKSSVSTSSKLLSSSEAGNKGTVLLASSRSRSVAGPAGSAVVAKKAAGSGAGGMISSFLRRSVTKREKDAPPAREEQDSDDAEEDVVSMEAVVTNDDEDYEDSHEVSASSTVGDIMFIESAAIRFVDTSPSTTGVRRVRSISQGGFGRVFLGQLHRESEDGGESVWMDCAIKVPRACTDDTFQQFQREIATLRALNHPNIVTFYGWCKKRFEEDDGPEEIGIVLEYCSYSLDESTPMRRLHPVSFFFQLCDALSYMHVRSYIHRDIKPNNILVSFQLVGGQESDWSRAQAKLCDFGSSKSILLDASTFTAHAGTAMFRPPEFRSGNYSTASDVYSLGMTMAQLCSNGTNQVLNSDGDLYGEWQTWTQRMTLRKPDFRPTLVEIMEWLESKSNVQDTAAVSLTDTGAIPVPVALKKSAAIAVSTVKTGARPKVVSSIPAPAPAQQKTPQPPLPPTTGTFSTSLWKSKQKMRTPAGKSRISAGVPQGSSFSTDDEAAEAMLRVTDELTQLRLASNPSDVAIPAASPTSIPVADVTDTLRSEDDLNRQVYVAMGSAHSKNASGRRGARYHLQSGHYAATVGISEREALAYNHTLCSSCAASLSPSKPRAVSVPSKSLSSS